MSHMPEGDGEDMIRQGGVSGWRKSSVPSVLSPDGAVLEDSWLAFLNRFAPGRANKTSDV